MAKSGKDVETVYQKDATRDLHAVLVPGGPGASLQLARRPTRSLRSLHPFPKARRLDGPTDALRRLWLFRRDDGPPCPAAAPRGYSRRQVDVVVV